MELKYKKKETITDLREFKSKNKNKRTNKKAKCREKKGRGQGEEERGEWVEPRLSSDSDGVWYREGASWPLHICLNAAKNVQHQG